MTTIRQTLGAIGDAWRGLPRQAHVGVAVAAFVLLVLLPFFFTAGGSFIDNATRALAYAVMALGLNIVVGFAGLLDLGYVAFYALGAFTIGWFGSGLYPQVNPPGGNPGGVARAVATVP